MVHRNFLIFPVIAAALAGCGRADVDYVIPEGHPASPQGQPGLMPGISAALEPELRTVKPNVGGGASAPAKPHSGGHKHH